MINLNRRIVYRGDVYDAIEGERINTLYGVLNDRYMDGVHDGLKRALSVLANDVKDIPAADVEEVKYGRWIWLSSTYDRTPCEMRYWCDKCHHEVITHGSKPWEKYCPNCGAPMVGGADNG